MQTDREKVKEKGKKKKKENEFDRVEVIQMKYLTSIKENYRLERQNPISREKEREK